MKNLLKFCLFVALLSLGISMLYDYQMRHGGLNLLGPRTPEKYTLASDPTVDPKAVASLDALNRERRVLVNSVVPSVVAVKTSKKITLRRDQALDPFHFFYRNARPNRNPNEDAMVQNSLGSGVIVTNEGHIITNNHVVDQVDEIEVQLSDGRTKKARLVGADAQVDLAVLKIDDDGVKPLKLADSDKVQVGDFVLAIGNPFGFEETVTDGIISSKGRPNRADAFGDLLQTNAAINPGNSGGPLINIRGEIVGINTAIISRSGGSQGIGFAIPSNNVRAALESLLKQGRIIRGYLGIQARPNLNQPNQSNNDDGVVIDDVVPGSPAAEAQLQKGDVIRKFDGHDVKTFPQLRTYVSQVDLNKKVEVEVLRDGKPMKLAAQIKEQPTDYLTSRAGPPQPGPQQPDDENEPDQPGQPLQPPPPNQPGQPGGGLAAIHVADLTPQMARQLDLPNGVRGVVVTGVDPDSGAAELQKGDVIEEVNQQPVPTVADYSKVISSLDPNQAQVLSVCRHRARSFLVLRPR
jgi:serine protease Do